MKSLVNRTLILSNLQRPILQVFAPLKIFLELFVMNFLAQLWLTAPLMLPRIVEVTET